MKKEKSNYLAVVLPVFIGLIAAIAGMWLYLSLQSQNVGETRSLQAITVLPESRQLPEFNLLDQLGAEFGNEQLKGHWSLLFFGYTHCPDICPTTLIAMKEVKQFLLDSPDPQSIPKVIFISVDPDRDTLERLAAYMPYFDPEFTGVTGKAQQISLLASSIGVSYDLHNNADELETRPEYLVDHSAAVLLINPQGKFHGVITPPLDPLLIARDYSFVTMGKEH